MSPWPDPLLILTAALTLAAVYALNEARAWAWARWRGTPKTPAPEGTGPPRTVPSSPGPGHAAARPAPAPALRKRIDVLFCGCTYIYDGAEQVWNVITCGTAAVDWDAELRRLAP